MDLAFKTFLLPFQCFTFKMEKNSFGLEPVSKGPMLTRTRVLNVSPSVASQDLRAAPTGWAVYLHQAAPAALLLTGWPHVCPGISLGGTLKSSVCGGERCD